MSADSAAPTSAEPWRSAYAVMRGGVLLNLEHVSFNYGGETIPGTDLILFLDQAARSRKRQATPAPAPPVHPAAPEGSLPTSP